MDEPPFVPPRDLAWALGAFHAALLMVLLVVLAHETADLGGILDSIGTARGLLVYAALLASTWWTASRALRSAGPEPPPNVAVGAGIAWGGANGVMFLAALVAIVVAPNIDAFEPALVLVLGFFTAGAAAVGGFAGGLFALLDWGLMRAAAALTRERSASRR